MSSTGVIEEIRRDPRAPSGLHCYLAGRNAALGGTDLARLRAGLRHLSGGKGAPDQAAGKAGGGDIVGNEGN